MTSTICFTTCPYNNAGGWIPTPLAQLQLP